MHFLSAHRPPACLRRDFKIGRLRLDVEESLFGKIKISFARKYQKLLGVIQMDKTIGLTARSSLAGRRVMITGAASGIGAGVAHLFKQNGADLALVDKSQDKLLETAKSCGAHSFVADLTLAEETAAAVASSANALGGLDAVVNAAGILKTCPFEEMELDDWSAQIATNMTAPFLVCRAAATYLRAGTCSTIVNVSSAIALRPFAGYSAYAASKAGLLSFTKSIAQELAPVVRVNAVCPGPIETPMIENIYSPESKARAMELYSLKRFGHISEVASVILFLSSEESSFITGTSIAVDGGRSFH